MEDDFAKALDALHNRIDGALETTQSVSLQPNTESWHVEPKAKAEESKAVKFLVRSFFVIFAFVALYIV